MLVLAATYVLNFLVAEETSIVAMMFAVMLLPDVTVISEFAVSTVNLSAGTISPIAYGDVPGEVTAIV